MFCAQMSAIEVQNLHYLTVSKGKMGSKTQEEFFRVASEFFRLLFAALHVSQCCEKENQAARKAISRAIFRVPA